MNRLKQLKTYPFGLFLVLEWIFLGAAILGEWPQELLWQQYFVSTSSDSSALLPLLSLFCLIGLGLMGLKLPKKKKKKDKFIQVNKWFYILAQLGLLLLPFAFNSDSSIFITAYLIVIIRACLIFEWQESLAATILIVMVIMFSLTLYYPDFPSFQSATVQSQAVTSEQYQVIKSIGIISGLFLFGLCATCISILVNALQREYESRQKLALAHDKLREYAMLAEEKATLDERNRIAREIHDSLGHALTAQSIQLDNAIAFWQMEPTKAYNFLTEAKTLVTTALREIRYSVATMRSDPLQEQNLETAIATLLKEFSQRTTIVPQCHISLPYPLSKEVKTTLYRIVQEALTNICKHSEATKVFVELQAFPEHLSLLIKDNGKGFDPQQNTTGFGLQGVRERVAALAGYLQMSSDFERGCTITVNIPRKQLIIL
jgi:signal transduction histidine kinase